MTRHLGCPRLSLDPQAMRAVKDEEVSVEFALVPGLVMSAVGPNHYASGDARLYRRSLDRHAGSF